MMQPMRAFGLLLLLAVLASPAWAQSGGARDSGDPDLGLFIREGAADEHHLWLLGQTGSVLQIDRRTGERTVVARDVTDILAEQGRVWALVAYQRPEWAVRWPGDMAGLQDLRRSDGELVTIYSVGEPVALFAMGLDRPGVLTGEAVLTPEDAQWSRTLLPAVIPGFAAAAHDGEGSVYVGYNLGEWGGGLRRIDLATGAIQFVTATAAGQRLQSASIIALGPDHGRPGCIIVVEGLQHLSLRRGSVSRLCGDQVEELLVRERSMVLPVEGDAGGIDGFLVSSDGWVVVHGDGYTRRRGEQLEVHNIPPLDQTLGGVRMSLETDGLVFIARPSSSATEQPPLAVPVY
jgi:hypothetical protein